MKKFKTFGANIRAKDAGGIQTKLFCSNPHSLLMDALRLSIEEVGVDVTQTRIKMFFSEATEES